MRISFEGTRDEIVAEMQDFLDGEPGSEPVPGAVAGANGTAKPSRRRGRPTKADVAAAAQVAAAQVAAAAPAPAVPTPPAAVKSLTQSQVSEGELKTALITLIKSKGATVAEQVITQEFGAVRATEIKPERWPDFVRRCAELTAPVVPPVPETPGVGLF